MSEVRNIQVQSVDERCPTCGKAFMRPTGIVTETNPPQYQHKCSACGYTQSYSIRYPYIVGQ